MEATEQATKTVEVLIKDNTELQVQLEHVKRLTLKNDSLKEEFRHKTNEVAKVTAELESTMTKLGCCQREKQSLHETVSQLTGNYAGLRAEHSAMQLLLQTEQDKCSRLAESLRQSQEREAEKDQQLQDAEMMRRDFHNTLQGLKVEMKNQLAQLTILPSNRLINWSLLLTHELGPSTTGDHPRWVVPSGGHGLVNLVDLCGSERLDESKVEGARLRETQHINRSLSNLGNVILALSQKVNQCDIGTAHWKMQASSHY
ncbi:carboxy-terminal kinesin 2 [Ixodes scapularis]